MEKSLYPSKTELYKQIARQARKAYVQDIDSETKGFTMYGALFHGFEQFLTLRLQERYGKAHLFVKAFLQLKYFFRKILKRRLRGSEALYNIFFEQLFRNIPELSLGEEVKEKGWQYILQPTVIYLFG